MVYLVQLFTTQELPHWASIEWTGIPRNLIIDKVWQSARSRKLVNLHNPFLSTTLKVWDGLRGVLVNDISVVSSFLNQNWFPPGYTTPFTLWYANGIYRIADIITKRSIIP